MQDSDGRKLHFSFCLRAITTEKCS